MLLRSILSSAGGQLTKCGKHQRTLCSIFSYNNSASISSFTEADIKSESPSNSTPFSTPELFIDSLANASENTAKADYAARRRQYTLDISITRKKFQSEIDEKKRLQAKEAMEKQKMKDISDTKDLEERRERVRLRSIEVAEETAVFRVMKDKEREERTKRRQTQEHYVAARKKRELNALRAASAYWIEEEDLEDRILEAMADPYHL